MTLTVPAATNVICGIGCYDKAKRCNNVGLGEDRADHSAVVVPTRPSAAAGESLRTGAPYLRMQGLEQAVLQLLWHVVVTQGACGTDGLLIGA